MEEGFIKVRISWVVAVCLVLGCIPPAVNGQDQEKEYQLFYVYDSLVKPSMKAEYFEAGKKLVAFWAKHEYPVACNTYWTDDNHVMWRFPIESISDIDKIYTASSMIEVTAPDEYKEVMDAFIGTKESSRMCVYALDLKHSLIA